MIEKVKAAYERHQKYLPVLFFIGGFIWDSLTLGRVDSLYSNIVLCIAPQKLIGFKNKYSEG